jgi:hypothetical protein
MIDGFKLPDDAVCRSNCGVVAVTVAAGLPYRTVENKFKLLPRIGKNRRWTGGTTEKERLEVMDAIGLEYETLEVMGMSLNRFCNDIAERNQLYMVTTTGHVQLVYKDNYGVIWYLDQQGMFDRDSRARSFRKRISHRGYGKPLRIIGGIMSPSKQVHPAELLPPVAIEMAKYRTQLTFNF